MARVVPHRTGHKESVTGRVYDQKEKRQSGQHSSTSQGGVTVAEETSENVPDIEKLRKKRTAYYARSPEHPRDVDNAKIATSRKHRSRAMRSSTTRTRVTTTSQRADGVQRSRPKRESGEAKSKPADHINPGDSVYVYNRAPSTVPAKGSVVQANGLTDSWKASTRLPIRSKARRTSETGDGQVHGSRSGVQNTESTSHSKTHRPRLDGHRHRAEIPETPHETVHVKIVYGVTGDGVEKIGTNLIHSAKPPISPPTFGNESATPSTVHRPPLRRSKTTSALPISARAARTPAPLTKPAAVDPTSMTTSIRTERRSSGLFSVLSKNTKPVKMAECLTCGDQVSVLKAAKLACDHTMCHECLKRVFELSTTDPQHMPPKCCTASHIPLRHVDGLFDDGFKRTWNKKYQEFTTKNRIYCPRKGCGEWLAAPLKDDKDTGRKYAKCRKCGTKVCPECNGKWHRNPECPKDAATEEFLETAKKSGWQECSCGAMVELKEGCHHITCRCNAQWCFLCRRVWKTCDCPWFPNIPQQPHEPFWNGQPPLPYQLHMDARRRQEQEDEALARRLQFGLALEDNGGRPNVFHFFHGNTRVPPRRELNVANIAQVLAAPHANAQRLVNALMGRHGAADPLPGHAGNREQPQPDRPAPAPTAAMQQEIRNRDPYYWLPAAMERDRQLLLDEEAGHWRRADDPLGLYTYNPASPPQRAADMAGLGGGRRGEHRVADWLDHVDASR